MGKSKITRNFQVTIPEDIREIKDLREGDEIIFMIDEGDVKLIKNEKNAIEAAKGIWDIDETGVEFERSRREEWEERRERELG